MGYPWNNKKKTAAKDTDSAKDTGSEGWGCSMKGKSAKPSMYHMALSNERTNSQQNEGKLPRAWRHIAPTHTHMYA